MLSNYLQRHLDRTGRKAWRAVERARPGGEWAVTFEPQTANADRDLDFVNLQHPLVGALLDEEPETVRPTAALRVVTPDHEPGTYTFFLYLIETKGFREGLEFLPVVVRADGGVDPALSDSLVALITDSVDRDPSSERPDDDIVTAAWDAAEHWTVERVHDREAELRQVSDQIIDRRIASMKDAHARWVTHKRAQFEQAEQNGHERIARMHAGSIRRRDATHADTLRRLEAEREVLIGHELVAGGVLEVAAT